MDSTDLDNLLKNYSHSISPEEAIKSNLRVLLDLQLSNKDESLYFPHKTVSLARKSYWDWEFRSTFNILKHYTERGLLKQVKVYSPINNQVRHQENFYTAYRILQEHIEEVKREAKNPSTDKSKTFEKPVTRLSQILKISSLT